jgi:hypothetical protein
MSRGCPEDNMDIDIDKIVGSKGERKLPALAVEIANPLHEELWKT